MLRVAPVVPLLALVPLAACSGGRDAQARGRDAGPRPVTTVAVRQDDVRRSIDIVGTLAAAEEAVISSEVDGKVNRILADLGDRVGAGQVLVELDREKLQYGYDAAKAAYAR